MKERDPLGVEGQEAESPSDRAATEFKQAADTLFPQFADELVDAEHLRRSINRALETYIKTIEDQKQGSQ